MTIFEFDIAYDYHPWGQAQEVYERIQYEDKLDLLQQYFEEMYPEGLRIVDINDVLSYESEDVLKYLGMMEEEEEEAEEEEEMSLEEIIKECDSFDNFCDRFFALSLVPS